MNPLQFPPWEAPTKRDRAAICPVREEAPQDFHKWASSLPPLSMLLFTDGSLQQNGSAGAGWAGSWGTARMEATCGHLSLANHEVFDAEATAALAGLKAAFSCPQTHLSSNLYILLDNQKAALQLQGTPVCSSQSTFLEFQKVAKEWSSRPNCLPALALCYNPALLVTFLSF